MQLTLPDSNQCSHTGQGTRHGISEGGYVIGNQCFQWVEQAHGFHTNLCRQHGCLQTQSHSHAYLWMGFLFVTVYIKLI